MKIFKAPFLLLLLVAACSENSPETEPVVFEQTDAITALAFDQVSVVVTGYNPTVHRFLVNGQSVETMLSGGSEISFIVPFKAGSGRIEIIDGDKTIQGPEFIYVPTYVPFYSMDAADGSTLAETPDKKLVSYDPLNNKIQQLEYKSIDGVGYETSLTMSETKTSVTVPNAALATYKVDQVLGMCVTPTNQVYLAQVYRDSPGSFNVFTPILTGQLSGNALTTVFEDANDRYREVLDIEVSANGNLFTIEKGKFSIRENTLSAVSIFAGSTSAGHQDGAGTQARFTEPNALTMDSNGNLYVADGNCIRKVTPAGVVTTIAGSPEEGNVTGPALQARFKKIMGLCITPSGTLYIADVGNDVIKTLKDGVVNTLHNTQAGTEGSTIPMFVNSLGIIFHQRGGVGLGGGLKAYVPENLLTEEFVKEVKGVQGVFNIRIE